MAQGSPQGWLELFHINNGERIQFSKLLSHWRLVIGFTSKYLVSHFCGKMCQTMEVCCSDTLSRELCCRNGTWKVASRHCRLGSQAELLLRPCSPRFATSQDWACRDSRVMSECKSGVSPAAPTVWLPTSVGRCVNHGDTCLPFLFDSRLLWWEIIALGLPICPAETFLDLSSSLEPSFLTSFFLPVCSEGNSHPHLLLHKHSPNKSLAHLIPTWCPLLGLPWWLRW